MLLGKIIAFILALATIICLVNWLALQKYQWGIATIINVIGIAIMVIVIKFASYLF